MNSVDTLQDYLDRVGAAVLAGDWDAYRADICLPFNLITQAANLTVETEAELRAGFDAFHSMLRTHAVTDYIRLVDRAAYLDDTLLSGSYVTHTLSRGKRVLQPYTSQITLRLEDARWRAASITNSLNNARWPLVSPSPGETTSPKGSDK